MQINPITSAVLIFSVALIVSACQPTTSELPEPNNSEESRSGATVVTENFEPGSADGDMMALSTTATYESPAGPENVSFTLILDEEGTIVEANTTVLGKAPISIMRQESFAEALPTVLQGKKLSELTSIDRVGGSSLTTGAFNNALEDLKAQM